MSYTRGQETFWNTLTMTFQNLCRLAWLSVGVTFGLFAVIFYFVTPKSLWGFLKFGFSWWGDIVRHEGVVIAITKLGNLIDYQIATLSEYTVELWISASSAIGLSFCFFFAAVYFFTKHGQKISADGFVSGARLVTGKEYSGQAKQLIRDQQREVARDTKSRVSRAKKSKAPFICTADQLAIPYDFLANHMAAIGATGTGKTTVIKHKIEHARATGGKGIVLDINGEIFSQVGQENDIVLSLFDTRSAFWDYSHEQTQLASIRPLQIAEYLIPSSNAGEPIWWKGPRIILEDLLTQCQSTAELWNLIQHPSEDLVTHLASGLAKKAAGKPDSKTAFSMVISTILDCRYFGFLNHWASQNQGEPFSILNWTGSRDPRWIFVITDEKDIAVSQPLMRLWFNIAIHGILTRAPYSDLPPVAVVIDEMRSIGKLDLLPSAVNRMRKYGGQGFFGYQSDSQLQHLYGSHDAAAINSGIGTKFVFNISNEKEAEAVAASFGKQEVKRKSFSTTYGVTSHSDRETLGEQIVSKPIVTATDLAKLPNGHCYIKSRAIDAVKTRILYKNWENKLPLHSECHAYPDGEVTITVPKEIKVFDEKTLPPTESPDDSVFGALGASDA